MTDNLKQKWLQYQEAKAVFAKVTTEQLEQRVKLMKAIDTLLDDEDITLEKKKDLEIIKNYFSTKV